MLLRKCIFFDYEDEDDDEDDMLKTDLLKLGRWLLVAGYSLPFKSKIRNPKFQIGSF